MTKKARQKPYTSLLEHDLIKYWLLNTPSFNTREAKRIDITHFIQGLSITSIDDFKKIKRSDIIDWRDSITSKYSNRSLKRKMSSMSKFFEHLCDEGILETNIVLGVERPKLTANEGSTSAISDFQAKDLLDAPDSKTLKGKRDRAILATFLFHALRRSELCQLQIKDIQEREGIKQFKIHGKGDKMRYVPIHPSALRRISEYLDALESIDNNEVALFRSLSNNGKNTGKPISPIAVYELVKKYGAQVGIDISNFSPHSLRATAATNTLLNGEDLRKVQKWLGHSNIQTTAMYDKRDNRPEDSPTYRVRY